MYCKIYRRNVVSKKQTTPKLLRLEAPLWHKDTKRCHDKILWQNPCGNIFWGLNKCTNVLLQRRTRRSPRSRIWFTLVWSRSPSPTCSPAGNTERTWLRSLRGWATVKSIETHRIHPRTTHTAVCCHLTLRWNLWEILKVYTTVVLYYRTRIFKGDHIM